MATDSIECPDCGAEIASDDHVDIDELPEIEGGSDDERAGFRFGPDRRDVFRCKGCGAVLGVRAG